MAHAALYGAIHYKLNNSKSKKFYKKSVIKSKCLITSSKIDFSRPQSKIRFC